MERKGKVRHILTHKVMSAPQGCRHSVFGKTSLYTCSVACVTWPHPNPNSSVATFQQCGVCKCHELLFI